MSARSKALLGAALLFLAYAATAAESALGGDGGEFAALAIRGGVAHPPGYPLFVLYLRALSFLPVAEPAHGAAIATCLLGAASAWLLFRAATSFGAGTRAAALVAAIFATSALTWKLTTYPEVFAGNAAIAMAIVWLSGPAPPLTGARRAAALALLAGLGVAHHHTIVLVAPIGIYGFFQAVREAARPGRALLGASLALSLGLSPYLYPVAAARGWLGPDVLLWGDTSTVDGLLHHFLRRDYGTLRLGAKEQERDAVVQLSLLGKTLFRDFLALPLVLAGALAVARRRVLPERARAAHGLLLASALLAGPVFVSLFNVSARGVGGLILERFHLLPAALALVFVAPAFDAPLSRLRLLVAALALALVAAVQSARALPEVVAHHRPTVQRYAENVLAIVEPNAVVVGSGDHRASSFLYAGAKGLRPDVLYVQPWLLLSDPYRERTSAALGLPLSPAIDRVLDGRRMLEEILSTGRPVYLTDWPAPGLERVFPSYPIGPVIRLVAEPREVLPPGALFDENERVFAKMVLDQVPPSRGTWAGSLYDDYARPWRVLARALADSGDASRAAVAAARARALSPGDGSSREDAPQP